MKHHDGQKRWKFTSKKYARLVRKGHVIHLSGDADMELVKFYRFQLKEFFKRGGGKRLVISLTIGGGDLTWANVLYDEIRSLCKEQHVVLLCEGKVRSVGLIVVMAVPRMQRFATARTDFRTVPHTFEHKGLKRTAGFGRSDQPSVDTTSQRERVAWENESIHTALLEGTHMSRERLTELLAKPHFIPAVEAQRLGIIHCVLS